MLPTLKNVKNMFLAVLPTKFRALMIILANQSFPAEEKKAVSKFITAILKEYGYCRSVIKKDFNKNFVMTVETKDVLNRVISAGYVVDCFLKTVLQ